MASLDFFMVPTATFRVLFVFVVLSHARRRVLHFQVTEHPTQEWAMQQIREAFPWQQVPRYLLRDRDAIYGRDFAALTQDMGMEEVVTAPRAPWQNPYVERLVGSIRRECLDHVIVWNQPALRRILRSYFAYYNYASYCPPRYVVENSKPSCSDVGIAGSRLLRRTRSTNLAAASVSSARWLITQGPSARGCSASISPRSTARRKVLPLRDNEVAASVRFIQPSALRRSTE
jgi:transposase InsO family protein